MNWIVFFDEFGEWIFGPLTDKNQDRALDGLDLSTTQTRIEGGDLVIIPAPNS